MEARFSERRAACETAPNQLGRVARRALSHIAQSAAISDLPCPEGPVDPGTREAPPFPALVSPR